MKTYYTEPSMLQTSANYSSSVIVGTEDKEENSAHTVNYESCNKNKSGDTILVLNLRSS